MNLTALDLPQSASQNSTGPLVGHASPLGSPQASRPPRYSDAGRDPSGREPSARDSSGRDQSREIGRDQGREQSRDAGRESLTPGLSRVLVVEDEPEIRDLIALHLKREGLKVEVAGSAEEATTFIEKQDFDLLLLDWMLPGASGLDITRALRKRADRDDLAILMVTARAEATDIVMGLEAGADDYLTKPFEPAVLLARVRALLRRNRRSAPEAVEKEDGMEVLRVGHLALYPDVYEVKCSGETLQLTPSEFKLLMALVQNRGRVLTRDSLIGFVQGEGVSVVGRTVDTHVFGLRKKLGACSDVIETVRGVGYRVRPFFD